MKRRYSFQRGSVSDSASLAAASPATTEASAAARSVSGILRSLESEAEGGRGIAEPVGGAPNEAYGAMGEESRNERRKSKRVSFQDSVDASIKGKDKNEHEETRNEADDFGDDEERVGISSIDSVDDEDEESARRLSVMPDNNSKPADIDPELQLDWKGGSKVDIKLHTDTC